MVTEERAKPAAQLRSHFLLLIRPESPGRFLPGKQDEDRELRSHLSVRCPRSQLVTKILLTAQWAEGKPELLHAQNSKASHPIPGLGTGFAVKNRHEKQSCEMAPGGAQLQPAAELKTLPQLFNSGELLGERPFSSTPKCAALSPFASPFTHQISHQISNTLTARRDH